MRTLVLREVPDEVVARLKRLAVRHSSLVTAMAVRELTDVTRRADNPALLGFLPDRDLDSAPDIVDIEADRPDP